MRTLRSRGLFDRAEVGWFEGNYQSYIEDLKRRKGADADQPHRIAGQTLVRVRGQARSRVAATAPRAAAGTRTIPMCVDGPVAP